MDLTRGESIKCVGVILTQNVALRPVFRSCQKAIATTEMILSLL